MYRMSGSFVSVPVREDGVDLSCACCKIEVAAFVPVREDGVDLSQIMGNAAKKAAGSPSARTGWI